MELGQRLDELEIAKKIVLKEIDDVPPFLSDEQEKGVRKLVSLLLAGSIAVKTWMLQEAYIQQRATTLAAKAAQLDAWAHQLRADNVSDRYGSAIRLAEGRAKQFREELYSMRPTSEARRYADLEKRLKAAESKLERHILSSMDKGKSKIPDSAWMDLARVPGRLARALADQKEGVGKSLLALQVVDDPRANALTESYTRRLRNITRELEKMGTIPSPVIAAKKALKAEADSKARVAAAVSTIASNSRSRNEDLESEARQALRTAGRIYMVAAIGQAISDLGDAIRY